MKALFTTALLAILMATATSVRAQDWRENSLGLPGDNLNLYATMKLFQESETLEGFEGALNSEDMGINNLDLNGDRLVDYINVTDYVDGTVHNIVLSVALSKKHRQDVAVFIVERFRNGSVQLQLVGDKALYGPNYIIEPYYDNNYAETTNPGYYGQSARNTQVTVVTTSAWEIATWPLMRHIYYPGYMAWHSPWDWGYWPAYYTAWQPWYWHYYNGYHYNYYNDYYAHYRPWNNIRYNRYNDFYYSGVRHWSKDVQRNINKGTYQDTYSRPELQNAGRALNARVATESNRTRINSGTSAASATRLSSAVPETARVRATSTAVARRADATVTSRTRTENGAIRSDEGSVRTRNTSGTIRNEAGVTRQESNTVRTRTEPGTIRNEEGTVRPQAVETSRRAAPATSGTTYTRPASTRSGGTSESSPAVSGESRSRVSGSAAPEVTGKSATRTEPSRSEVSRPAAPSGNEGYRTPVNTRSSETYSAPRTRTETAPRTTTTVRQESSAGSSAGRVSTRSSSESSGSTKVATRPTDSGSSSRSSSSVERSSPERSSRESGSSNESSSGRGRR